MPERASGLTFFAKLSVLTTVESLLVKHTGARMAQIFLSYASEDVERARALVSALGNAGWSVWWDDGIAPGRRFDNVISEELAKDGLNNSS